MELKEIILNFNKQLAWQPEIKNADKLQKKSKFIAVGMGGSHLAADILKAVKPKAEIIIHEDYNLPEISEEEIQNSLFIISSYSGNTEESLDVFQDALNKNLSIFVIASNGELLKLAEEKQIPYIELPEKNIQPRFALGWSFIAFAKAIGEENLLIETRSLSEIINLESLEKEGKKISDFLKNKVPVIYASRRNSAVAYNWKIKFNETSKIPAFYNVFPELNHNEMSGFDFNDKTKNLSENFSFIFLRDSEDEEQVIKRMDITEKIYAGKNIFVLDFILRGKTRLEKIFEASIVADWASLKLAEYYDNDPEPVKIVEEFKKLMKE